MKKLHRSSKDKILGGLCGGLGAVYSVDPTLVRLIRVFLCIITGIVPCS